MIISGNKKLIFVIAVILAGIFLVLLIGVTQNSQEDSPAKDISDIVDNAKDNIDDAWEEVVDEVDDHTDSK